MNLLPTFSLVPLFVLTSAASAETFEEPTLPQPMPELVCTAMDPTHGDALLKALATGMTPDGYLKALISGHVGASAIAVMARGLISISGTTTYAFSNGKLEVQEGTGNGSLTWRGRTLELACSSPDTPR